MFLPWQMTALWKKWENNQKFPDSPPGGQTECQSQPISSLIVLGNWQSLLEIRVENFQQLGD